MKTKFEKINDGLFSPLKENELNKIRGGYGRSCTTGIFTSRIFGSGVKLDGSETEEDSAA